MEASLSGESEKIFNAVIGSEIAGIEKGNWIFAPAPQVASGDPRVFRTAAPVCLAGNPFRFHARRIFIDAKSLLIEAQAFFIEAKSFYIDENPFLIEAKSFYIDENPFLIEAKSFYIDENPFLIEAKSFYIDENPLPIEAKSFYIDENPLLIEANPFYIDENPPRYPMENRVTSGKRPGSDRPRIFLPVDPIRPVARRNPSTARFSEIAGIVNGFLSKLFRWKLKIF